MNNMESSTIIELAELTAKSTADNPDGGHTATVSSTLRALAAHDSYWDRFPAGLADSCATCDLIQLRTLLAAADDRELAEPQEFLGRLGLRPEEIKTVVTELRFGSRQAQNIQDAFAHTDPAATTQALEELSERAKPGAIRERLARLLTAQAGKMTLGYIIVMCALMSVLGLACSIVMAPMYKGVSAD